MGQHGLECGEGVPVYPALSRGLEIWQPWSPCVSLFKARCHFCREQYTHRLVASSAMAANCQLHLSVSSVSLSVLPHGPCAAESQRLPVQETRRRQWRLGPCNERPVPGVLAPFLISLHCLLVQAWSTPALPEPAFIKQLWLEPLKTRRRIFMFNLLVFSKCQQFNLFFGFFFAALGEINFSYRQQGDLP